MRVAQSSRILFSLTSTGYPYTGAQISLTTLLRPHFLSFMEGSCGRPAAGWRRRPDHRKKTSDYW